MNLRTRSLLALAAVLWLMGMGLARGGWPCKLCGKSKADCETCEQPRHICQPVCETKAISKVVYRIKEIPYCRHNCPCSCCKEGCDSCDSCVYYRRVLTKKSVKAGEHTITKCVVQEICPECGGVCSPATAVGPAPTKPAPAQPLPPQEKNSADPAPKPTREVPAKSASARDPEASSGTPAPPPDETE